MKTISLKIDNTIFSDTEIILSHLKKSRTRYINEAIDHYNKILQRKILQKALREESRLVTEDSMNVLKEFEALDNAKTV